VECAVNARQCPTAGLTDLGCYAGWRVTGYRGSHLGRSAPPRDERSFTVSRGRRRRPVDALIELEVRLGLLEEFPVRHRLGFVVPGGRSAGGRDRGRAGWLTDAGEDLLDGRGLGDEGNDAHGLHACGSHCRIAPVAAAWPTIPLRARRRWAPFVPAPHYLTSTRGWGSIFGRLFPSSKSVANPAGLLATHGRRRSVP